MIRIELIRGPAKAKSAAVAFLNRVLPPGAAAPAAVIRGLAAEEGISRQSLSRAKISQQVQSVKTRGRAHGSWLWIRPIAPCRSDG